MTVELVEILRRSVQGATNPYICRADNGEVYFVKGVAAGRASLIKELICGRLAQALGLPIAPFEVLRIPAALVSQSDARGLSGLDGGFAFGSLLQAGVSEISYPNVKRIPENIKMSIVSFDWFIRNSDRTLSILGGNPNILWSSSTKSALIFDHNLSFEGKLDLSEIVDSHIFGHQMRTLCCNGALQQSFRGRYELALNIWDDIVDEIPEEWFYADDRRSVLTNFSLENALESLTRCRNEDFFEC